MAALDGLDLAAFAGWTTAHAIAFEAPLEGELVAGGHSCLTYLVTDATGRKLVVRRPPLGHVLQSAHDVVREHRIVSALAPTDVPVAPTLGVCDDPDVIGAPFFVMEFVDGGVVHEAPDVAAVMPTVPQRRFAAESLVDALVALHSVDVDTVGLGDLSRRGGYLDRQLKRWAAQWEASRTRELPDMDRLHDWLVRHRPEPSRGVSIVHGDFRLGNSLHAADGRVVAMLDWELCTLGEPMADLSYLMRSWVGPDEPAGYREPPTRAGGFPDRDELVERYAAGSGRSVEALGYWMAFNAWRSAAISEGVLRRYLDGAMGDQDADLDGFRQGVEATVADGLTWTARPPT